MAGAAGGKHGTDIGPAETRTETRIQICLIGKLAPYSTVFPKVTKVSNRLCENATKRLLRSGPCSYWAVIDVRRRIAKQIPHCKCYEETRYVGLNW